MEQNRTAMRAAALHKHLKIIPRDMYVRPKVGTTSIGIDISLVCNAMDNQAGEGSGEVEGVSVSTHLALSKETLGR